ncbi:MAG: branched-chain amino acid ABC transporter permease [Alphaproteobacteria bacterium]
MQHAEDAGRFVRVRRGNVGTPPDVALSAMLAEQIFNGIVLGGMYALIAVGYALVFGVLDKLNFAHSEVFMLGGFAAIVTAAMGAPLWASLVLAIVVCGALGLLIEIVSFRKFVSADAQITAALSSLALGLIFIDLVQKQVGTDPVAVPISTELRTAGFQLFGVQVIYVKLAILVVSLAVMIALHQLVMRTRIGRNIRAVAGAPQAARLLGIDVRRVNQQVFFIASAMAGIAGLMLALRTGFAPSDIGFTFGLKALAIMAIGGMGDLRGAVLGGLLVGVLEGIAGHLGLDHVADVAVWVLMILVLLVRPAGLFSRGQMPEPRA